MDGVKEIADAYAHVREIRNSVETLHKKVIGLFRPNPLQKPELVIRNDNGHLMCASFSPLGYVSTLHINANDGVLVMFDEGENLETIDRNKLTDILETIKKK